MDEIWKMDTIEDANRLLGVETLHPMISVVNLSTLDSMKIGRKSFGVYSIFLKELDCGTVAYGRNKYDYQQGTLIFIAPGQIAGAEKREIKSNPKGWVLMFHPDLLYGTPLARAMKNYHFFSYSSNEALHLSERERQIIINGFKEIQEELQHAIDKHSKQILAANIEVILNHCERFYDRQFTTREIMNHDLLSRFENLMLNYFKTDKPQTIGLPSVQYCADQLHLSANYFGDLIKKETGKSAQEYIQTAIIEQAKEILMENNRTISEVAYDMGFKYPHHLSRMFKKVTGKTPNEYRAIQIPRL